MPNFVGRYLENVQSADDASRRRWVISMSIIMGVIVVGVWIFYIANVVVPSTPSITEEPAGATAEATSTTEAAGFFKTLGNGLGVVYDTAAQKTAGVWQQITRSAVGIWSGILTSISSDSSNPPEAQSTSVEPEPVEFVPALSDEPVPPTSLTQ